MSGTAKTVVTGGTGFLGANLVRHLLQRGERVVCLTRRSSPGLCLDGLDVELDQTPLDDVEALKRVLDGARHVYHLAGIFDPSPGGEQRMHDVHVGATRRLLDAGLAAGVERLLLCSSSVTVGFGGLSSLGTEEDFVDATQVYGSSGALRAYHDSKLEAEELVRRHPLDAVTVNPDYILGAWDIKPTSGQMVLTMAQRWLPVYPRGGKCFMDADACAMGHIEAMHRGVSGERYLLGDHNHSYREFMGMVAEVVGRRPPLLPMPRRLASIVGAVGKVAQRVDEHRFAGLDGKVLASMGEQRYRDGRKAIEGFTLPRTPIRESIEKCVRWFRDHDRL